MRDRKIIYLDHLATTPVDVRVLAQMLPYFTEMYGNASSNSHIFGWDAEEAVATAREQVAALLGAKSSEIYFTSGATESINLALFGYCEANQHRGKHVITCQTEHKAVLDVCSHLLTKGFEVTFLPVQENGLIAAETFAKAIRKDTILACIMHANNETGVIQPIAQLATLAKTKAVAFMTDATQSAGKIPTDVNTLNVDLLTLSAHKMYGPKGSGALYVRKQPKTEVTSRQLGGSQEKGLRAGTLNVPGIVGLGAACSLAQAEMDTESNRLSLLRDQLERALLQLPGIIINGQNATRLPHVSNFSIQDIQGTALLRNLKKIAVSQGSACNSATQQASHVLLSMGLEESLALATLRIGLGRDTTAEDLSTALEEIQKTILQLRQNQP